MIDHDLDENWLVSEPVVTQWYDSEARRLRYLGFSSPPNWRSHLTLNLGLDISESKREALCWFRLPIRVKSQTTKRPTKFYVYFIVEPDMFNVGGEDHGLSFSQQPNVPPPVQFAFKGSNVCQSDDELIRLRFSLKKPGVVVMPKAEESPFEPSAINQEVLLALKSLSEATKFSAYVPQSSLSISHIQSLCWMVQHGDLQSRPRELHTLYHGKGGEVNAWGNFVFASGPGEVAGASGMDNPTESSVAQETVSSAKGLDNLTKATSAKPPSEKQATAAEVKEEAVVESVEKDDRPKAAQLNEYRAEERQGSIPPTYQEAGSPPPPAASTATARPLARTAKSLSISPAGADPGTIRHSSAPPTFPRPSEGHHALSVPLDTLPKLEPLSTVTNDQAAVEHEDQAAPPSYKRSKPPSDDELGDDDLETTTTSAKDSKTQKPHLKSETASKARRPSKQVRFNNDDATNTTTRRNRNTTATSSTSSSRRTRPQTPPTTTASSPPSHHQSFPSPLPLPLTISSSSSSTTTNPPSLTALASALPKPQSTLLRQTVDWFKWAWTTTTTTNNRQRRRRGRHIIDATAPLTHPHLRELGRAAREGDRAAFYRARSRCSARVLWESYSGGDAGGTEDGGSSPLLGELEAFLLWMAGVAPEAETALTGELRELGALAREGEEAWLEHGMAVCAGFVVFWFGRVDGVGA